MTLQTYKGDSPEVRTAKVSPDGVRLSTQGRTLKVPNRSSEAQIISETSRTGLIIAHCISSDLGPRLFTLVAPRDATRVQDRRSPTRPPPKFPQALHDDIPTTSIADAGATAPYVWKTNTTVDIRYPPAPPLQLARRIRDALK